MDPTRFDALAKALGSSANRRAALGLAAALAALRGEDAEAAKCRKPCGECKRCKRGKCKPARDGTSCGIGKTCQNGRCKCPSGKISCPDGRCGVRCCANGRACDQACGGPAGNNYCCPADRPMSICGNCYPEGSSVCEPGHNPGCCGPGYVCCGKTHCCFEETQECRVNCGGVPGSNSCCIKGSGPTCCEGGLAG